MTLELDRRAQTRGLEPGPHHPLRERDTLRAPAVDLLRERERLGHEVAVGNDLRDEPDLGGFSRADVAPREHDLERTRGADGPRQQEAQAELGGGEPVVDSGSPEVGRLARDSDVRTEREAEPAADRRAVDRADDGLRHPLHGRHQIREDRHRPRRDARECEASDVRRRFRVLGVRAGTESTSRAGQDDAGRTRCRLRPAAKASCSGTISSKAIEFIRSGRSRTITLVPGSGFSIRTRDIGDSLTSVSSWQASRGA